MCTCRRFLISHSHALELQSSPLSTYELGGGFVSGAAWAPPRPLIAAVALFSGTVAIVDISVRFDDALSMTPCR